MFQMVSLSVLRDGLRQPGVRHETTRHLPERASRPGRRGAGRSGASGLQRRVATALSGGESRRVALARALVIEPALLLLDEPLANVDRESATRIESLIEALPDRGTTVVFSSHDPQQSCRTDCQRIRLVDGTLEEAYTVMEHNWEEPTYACL